MVNYEDVLVIVSYLFLVWIFIIVIIMVIINGIFIKCVNVFNNNRILFMSFVVVVKNVIIKGIGKLSL